MLEAARAEPPVISVDVEKRDATVASELSAPPTTIVAAVAVVEVSSAHDVATPAARPRVLDLHDLQHIRGRTMRAHL